MYLHPQEKVCIYFARGDIQGRTASCSTRVGDEMLSITSKDTFTPGTCIQPINILFGFYSFASSLFAHNIYPASNAIVLVDPGTGLFETARTGQARSLFRKKEHMVA